MRRLALTLVAALLLAGCLGDQNYGQAVAVLIDVSGTYADQKAEVVKIVKRDVLPSLVPGDTLVILRIDSQSYEKGNVETLVTLDTRPSRANAQKLALAEKLDAFAASGVRSEHTDIPGAMMLAAEYLREIDARSRVMLVFSDMREELPTGARRQLGAAEFADIRIAALNVKRLHTDGADPALFRTRLAQWERRVTDSGALGWRIFTDAGKLSAYLDRVREETPAAGAARA